jgi:hypothetical protein
MTMMDLNNLQVPGMTLIQVEKAVAEKAVAASRRLPRYETRCSPDRAEDFIEAENNSILAYG